MICVTTKNKQYFSTSTIEIVSGNCNTNWIIVSFLYYRELYCILLSTLFKHQRGKCINGILGCSYEFCFFSFSYDQYTNKISNNYLFYNIFVYVYINSDIKSIILLLLA